MENYIGQNFLLTSDLAKDLYHCVAANQPIIDYHNHLDINKLYVNTGYENLSQIWLNPDPYKHRAMRVHGIKEKFITGNGSDLEKFQSWAKIFPKTIGNPLHQWSCLELKRVFGIEEALCEGNSREIWEICNGQLGQGGIKPMDLLKNFKVEILCTSDDILDDISQHTAFNNKANVISVFPSVRGDKILDLENIEFHNWLKRFSSQVKCEITTLEIYKMAIRRKLDQFKQIGCCFADLSLDAGFTFSLPGEAKASELFDLVLQNNRLESQAVIELRSYLLVFLGSEFSIRNWTLQLHIGAQRNINTTLFRRVGLNGGYACIGSPSDIDSLTLFLDTLDKNCRLPRIILFNLNPADNSAFASITGSYTQEGMTGKVQIGPPWWYNDHGTGIRQNLQALTDFGFLSCFIGMTTDSRSLMSLSRHEYFRRILCSFISDRVSQGMLPESWKPLENLVKDITYQNSKNWFNFNP